MTKTIKPNELKKLLEIGDAILIDVREPAEHKIDHIKEAWLIPLGDICCEVLPSKVGPIIIHCKSGKRSEDACRKLLEEDPNLEIYSLEGGIIAWKQSGY